MFLIDCFDYREIKFNVFLNEAKNMGADMIATGHYAKITKYKDHFVLDTPKDSSKDQSYFLHALSSEQLSQAMFPLGDLTKKEVREIARAQIFLLVRKKIAQEFVLLVIKNLMSLLLNTYKQSQVILLMKMEKF